MVLFFSSDLGDYRYYEKARARKAIEALGECDMEKRLGSHFGARYFEFTYRKMLHGISDHNIYHAGQVSLLKKK